MELRDAVVALGATEAQLSSKIFAMTEQAVADGAVDGLSDARKSVQELNKRVESALHKIVPSITMADKCADALDDRIKSAREVLGALDGSLDEIKISDQNLRDAVNAYTLILSRTKQVLGDNAMTEAVTIQLLETASYGLWRSIMGPKEQKPAGRVYR